MGLYLTANDCCGHDGINILSAVQPINGSVASIAWTKAVDIGLFRKSRISNTFLCLAERACSTVQTPVLNPQPAFEVPPTPHGPVLWVRSVAVGV
jgi:hypothetical protein